MILLNKKKIINAVGGILCCLLIFNCVYAEENGYLLEEISEEADLCLEDAVSEVQADVDYEQDSGSADIPESPEGDGTKEFPEESSEYASKDSDTSDDAMQEQTAQAEDALEPSAEIPYIRFKQDYVRLNPGEHFTPETEANFEPSGELTYKLEGDAVSLDNALVTAKQEGIATITVCAVYDGMQYSAECRVEVVNALPVKTGISEIRLVTASVTAQVFKTDYAQIRISPVFSADLSLSSDTLRTDTSEAVIERAEFTNSEIKAYFTLRVKDNETLQILPTAEAIEAALSKNKSLKSSYVTGITVYANGKEYTPYESVKIQVRRAKPSVKAESIVFNSYPAKIGEKYSIVFTGGTVQSCELIGEAPSWLEINPDEMTLSLSRSYIPDKYSSGKLKLSCKVEGWAIPATAVLKYSGKCYTPKLTFSEKSITVFAGKGDRAEVAVTVSSGIYKEETVSLVRIEQKTESGYAEIHNKEVLSAEYSDGVLTVFAPAESEDKQEHIYRVVLSVLDKEYACNVRVPAADYVPKPSLKTAGYIDTAVQGSLFKITPVKKNFHSESTEEYSLKAIEQYKGKRLVNADVSDLFSVSYDGKAFLIGEKSSGSVADGYTYRAVIALHTAAGEATCSVTVKCRNSAKSDTAKLALSAEGRIITGDADSYIILTPSSRSRKKKGTITVSFFKKKDGQTVKLKKENCPLTATENEDGTYFVRCTGTLENGAVYYVRLSETSGTKTYTSKFIKLTVQ